MTFAESGRVVSRMFGPSGWINLISQPKLAEAYFTLKTPLFLLGWTIPNYSQSIHPYKMMKMVSSMQNAGGLRESNESN